jgi:hypothetical protein
VRRRILCAALATIALPLAGCTSSGDGGALPHGTGTEAGSSDSAFATPSPTSTAIELHGDDPCKLLTTKQAKRLLDATSIRVAAGKYDIKLVLTKLYEEKKTTDAQGYEGSGKTCAFAGIVDPKSQDFAGISLTLIIDATSKSSYELFGLGVSPENDVTDTVGAQSEVIPKTHSLAIQLTRRAWILLSARKVGQPLSEDLAIAVAKQILANLRAH